MKKVIVSLIVLIALVSSTFSCQTSGEKVKESVVKLTSAHEQCSGIQVKAPSGMTYILTAGHCKGIADASGSILVMTEDKKQVQRKIIAEDPASDLLLLEGAPGVPGLDVASHDRRGQFIRTFTHGHGLDTYETDGILIGDLSIKIPAEEIDLLECVKMPKYKKETIDMFFGITADICALEVTETVTNALIIPGASGGAAVDSRGHLIGICSATGGGLGYLVTLKDINKFLKGY
jgi:hypothetical protein